MAGITEKEITEILEAIDKRLTQLIVPANDAKPWPFTLKGVLAARAIQQIQEGCIEHLPLTDSLELYCTSDGLGRLPINRLATLLVAKYRPELGPKAAIRSNANITGGYDKDGSIVSITRAQIKEVWSVLGFATEYTYYYQGWLEYGNDTYESFYVKTPADVYPSEYWGEILAQLEEVPGGWRKGWQDHMVLSFAPVTEAEVSKIEEDAIIIDVT